MASTKKVWRKPRSRKKSESRLPAAKAKMDEVASAWLKNVNPMLDLNRVKLISGEPVIVDEFVPGNRKHPPSAYPERRVSKKSRKHNRGRRKSD